MATKSKYQNRSWSVPHKRAKGFAEERKAKIHLWGPKKGKELTAFEAGIRSGYLMRGYDSAQLYHYKNRKELESTLKQNQAEQRRANKAKAKSENKSEKSQKAAVKSNVKAAEADKSIVVTEDMLDIID